MFSMSSAYLSTHWMWPAAFSRRLSSGRFHCSLSPICSCMFVSQPSYRGQCEELVLRASAASLYGDALQPSTGQLPFREPSKSEVPLMIPSFTLCYAMRSHYRSDRYHHLPLPVVAQALGYLTEYQ